MYLSKLTNIFVQIAKYICVVFVRIVGSDLLFAANTQTKLGLDLSFPRRARRVCLNYSSHLVNLSTYFFKANVDIFADFLPKSMLRNENVCSDYLIPHPLFAA